MSFFSPRTIFIAVLALLALALPAAANAATHRQGAVVFSQTTTVEGVEEGGIFAVRDGNENQLTENPADTEPSFSPDGRTIAFAREGHIYTVRPDGSGERRLTNGQVLDSRPQISPNGRIVLFERRSAEGEPANLYTVSVNGGAAKDLTRAQKKRAKPASPPTARRSSSSASPRRPAAAPTPTSTRSAPAAPASPGSPAPAGSTSSTRATSPAASSSAAATSPKARRATPTSTR